MNTTILLSTQRSGTSFIDAKLNGMCGIKSKLPLGGELISPDFYNKHNIVDVVKCDNLYDDKQHLKPRFYKTDHFEDNCYVEVNKHLLKSIVNKSEYAVFNAMLDAVRYNIEMIQSIKTPILFLIRKNQWSRCVSDEVMNKCGTSHIKQKTENIEIKLNKEKIIKNCKGIYKKIIAFQKKLKNQKNVKIIYYEDVQNKEYWTDEFIKELEDFMKVKFTNRNYIPPFKKTRNFVNIINEAEIMDEEYIKKYYIKEI